MPILFCWGLIIAGFVILIFNVNAPFRIIVGERYAYLVRSISGNAGWLFILIGLFLQYGINFCQ